MAKINSESPSNYRGRLGNVVYYEVNGKTCVRSLPSSYTDKKSEKQLIQRKRFSTLGKLFTVFRPAIRFENLNAGLNKSSMFTKLNWNNVLIDSTNTQINFESLILCEQVHFELLNLKVLSALNTVLFQWDADNVLNESFLVLCAVYCKGIQQVYVNEVKRTELSTSVPIPKNAGEILTYTFTYRRNL